MFGLRAWDEDGRSVAGPVSNLVVASLEPYVYVPGPGDSTDVGLIVGVALGVVAFVAIAAALVGFVLYKKRWSGKVDTQTKHATTA